MSLGALLAPLVDAPLLDLEQVAHVLVAEDGDEASLDFERLLALSTRLPSGLVQAEGVWITSAPPVALEPLAPGSAWYALDRQLIFTVAPGRAALINAAIDLARYALQVASVGRVLGPQRELVAALADAAPLDAAASSRLALGLGGDPQRVAEIDRLAPGLRADLATMADRAFRPKVQLHASTRPSRWRRLGASIARRLLEAVPAGPFRLALSDRADLVEHLSPYARDLAPTLLAWGHENPRELSLAGLREALPTLRGHPPDHAALVARDLIRSHPEALAERRVVERAAGLELFDEAGMVFGYADVATLPAPDPRAIPAGSRGVLVVIAGPSDDTLSAAAAALIESGRVDGLAIAAASGPELDGPVAVPELLVSPEDALPIEHAAKLARRAESLGVRVSRARRANVDDAGAPPWAFDVLRLARRGALTGVLPGEARLALALYGRSAAVELEAALAGIQAARVALMGLQLADHGGPARGVEGTKPPNSLRFRA